MTVFFRLFLLANLLLTGGCASSEEYFYLTHYKPIYESKNHNPPPVDDPSYADTIIYINENRIGLHASDCNGEIEKISPFSQSRAFVNIVDDAGGDVAFKKFLKTKIHTDIDKWQNKYQTKFQSIKSEIMACELLKKSMIFRSANEIIITDTTYFYRFLLGKKPI